MAIKPRSRLLALVLFNVASSAAASPGAAPAAAVTSTDDLTALNALKASISNFDTIRQQSGLTSWNDSYPCGQGGNPWAGVKCASGRVTELHLYQVTGSNYDIKVQVTALPNELDRLTAVTTVDLSGPVAVSGTSPASWGANGGFAKLQQFGINSSPLTGSLPPEWGASDRFPQLIQLAIQDCQLTGSLPDSWGSSGTFPKLRSLVLNGNNMQGQTPASWQGREFTGYGLDMTDNPNFQCLAPQCGGN